MTGNLREMMAKIIKDVEYFTHEGRDHVDICHSITTDYGLWENDLFPVWLSRVVAGVMNDVTEASYDSAVSKRII